jgi:hypothetical protein
MRVHSSTTSRQIAITARPYFVGFDCLFGFDSHRPAHTRLSCLLRALEISVSREQKIYSCVDRIPAIVTLDCDSDTK